MTTRRDSTCTPTATSTACSCRPASTTPSGSTARIDVGAWHLHDLRSRGLTGSRGLASGDVLSADGIHAATVTQEVLLRVRGGS